MDTPRLLLARVWGEWIDPTGWWLSEKLDGVRAYWNGHSLVSRQGNQYRAPGWFTADLPAIPLDGELWIGRGQFQQTTGVVRRKVPDDGWRLVEYRTFDAPTAGGPFEARYACLGKYLRGCKHAARHIHYRCQGREHLRRELTDVDALGGEGLMLRQPGSLYEGRRSSTLLKVKSMHDVDAVVVDHLPGRGKHVGRLGAVVARLSNGTEFAAGTGLSDADRASPPPIGQTITVQHQGFTDAGVPRFPVFLRCSTQ